jgi:hypothetical protein
MGGGCLSRSKVYSFYNSLTNPLIKRTVDQQKDPRRDFKRALQQVLATVCERSLTIESARAFVKSWHIALWKTSFFMFGDIPSEPVLKEFKDRTYGKECSIWEGNKYRQVICKCIIKASFIGVLEKIRKNFDRESLKVFVVSALPESRRWSLAEATINNLLNEGERLKTLQLDYYQKDVNKNPVTDQDIYPFIAHGHTCGLDQSWGPFASSVFWLSSMPSCQPWDHLIAESVDVETLNAVIQSLPKDILEMILEYLQVNFKRKTNPETVDAKLKRLCGR